MRTHNTTVVLSWRLAALLAAAAVCASSATSVGAGAGPVAVLAGASGASSAAVPVDVWGGANESIALKSDGSVWTWGWNDYGILGNGFGVSMFDTSTQFDSLYPVQVLGPGGVGHLAGITAIAGGERHNAALDAGGEVWMWGWDYFGQLGNGTQCAEMSGPSCMGTTPAKVPGFINVKAIASRGYHTVALKNDGTVWAWGYNANGRVGDGTTQDQHRPAQVGGLGGHGGVTAISSGGDVMVALMADHTLMAWGRNYWGEVGIGTFDTADVGQLTPIAVSQSTGLSNVKAVATGWSHVVALAADGTVWTWGKNANGELGDGTLSHSNVPRQVSGLTGVIGVSAGDASTAVLKSDGTVWTWGSNDRGELGDGQIYPYSVTPVQVVGLTNVVLVRARDFHNLAIKADGSLWTWGWNIKGAIGDGTVGDSKSTPVQVMSAASGGTPVPSSPSSPAVTPVIAWATPAAIAQGTALSATQLNASATVGGTVVAGTFAYTPPAGTVLPVGTYALSAAFTPTNGSSYTSAAATAKIVVHLPATLSAPPAVVSLWGGARHSLILKSDGSVWDWGINLYGKLGDGTTSTYVSGYVTPTIDNDRHTPVRVHGPGNVGYLNAITAVMGGESHNFALASDGTVWSWGWNSFGQLGDGTNTDRYTPVQVSGLDSIVSLGGRGYHSLVVRSDGTVWTWGFNASGQLGDATTTNRNVPAKVAGLSGVQAVTGGYNFSLALMSDYTLRAWGSGSSGQLGSGSTAASATPAPVSGLTNVAQVSAGWKHAVAVRFDGTVWTWGQNANGELGNGTIADSAVPVRVDGLTNVIAVSGGDCHTAALKSDGTVWAWGCNNTSNGVGNFELGDGTGIERHTPVQVVGLANVVAIAARDYHNLALKADGSVWAWGFNQNGQLGDATTIDRSVAVEVALGTANAVFVGPATGGPAVGSVSGTTLSYNGATYPVVNGKVTFPDCTLYIALGNGLLIAAGPSPGCVPGTGSSVSSGTGTGTGSSSGGSSAGSSSSGGTTGGSSSGNTSSSGGSSSTSSSGSSSGSSAGSATGSGGTFVGPGSGGPSTGSISGTTLTYGGTTYQVVNGKVTFPDCSTYIALDSGILIPAGPAAGCTPGGGSGTGSSSSSSSGGSSSASSSGSSSGTGSSSSSGGGSSSGSSAGSTTSSGGAGFAGPGSGGPASGSVSGTTLAYGGATYPMVNGKVTFPDCSTYIALDSGILIPAGMAAGCTPGGGSGTGSSSGGSSSGTGSSSGSGGASSSGSGGSSAGSSGGAGFAGPRSGGPVTGSVKGTTLSYNGATYPIVNGKVTFPDCSIYIALDSGILIPAGLAASCAPGDSTAGETLAAR